MVTRELELPLAGALRLVAVADSHGRPHKEAARRVREAAPGAILHAGDVGALSVLDELEAIAPVIAVRGNVDSRQTALPDIVRLHLVDGAGAVRLRVILIHIATQGPRLLGAVRRLAFEQQAQLVVCGHSHLPWLGLDGEIAVFNPGSIGPRRFALPITFGLIEVEADGVQLTHLDCESGQRWTP